MISRDVEIKAQSKYCWFALYKKLHAVEKFQRRRALIHRMLTKQGVKNEQRKRKQTCSVSFIKAFERISSVNVNKCTGKVSVTQLFCIGFYQYWG